MRVFFDTSAWVKRYQQEAGSDRVRTLVAQSIEVISSKIVLPETVSAFCRLRREERLNREQYQLLKLQLLEDVRHMELLELSSETLAFCINVLEQFNLRAMDAIHIGTALTVRVDSFVSADQRQLAAAKALGLAVEAV